MRSRFSWGVATKRTDGMRVRIKRERGSDIAISVNEGKRGKTVSSVLLSIHSPLLSVLFVLYSWYQSLLVNYSAGLSLRIPQIRRVSYNNE